MIGFFDCCRTKESVGKGGKEESKHVNYAGRSLMLFNAVKGK